MKITILRPVFFQGSPVSAGEVLECTEIEGKTAIAMQYATEAKAEPAAEEPTTDTKQTKPKRK